ncbi:hypothetical protein H0H92_003951 [Tricholoma furcatifolium]|nr:hypothetical protein H0H92_003951 [Tricholoma furcatifolium]
MAKRAFLYIDALRDRYPLTCLVVPITLTRQSSPMVYKRKNRDLTGIVSGDFAIFLTDKERKIVRQLESFTLRKVGSFYHDMAIADDPEVNKVPLDIQQTVQERDKGQCFFTGKTGNTVMTWIVPPVCNVNFRSDIDFLVAENVITIHKDLEVLFLKNQLMVDVDKDLKKFEVLAFQRIQTTFNLPERVGRYDSVLKFLRLHCDRGVLEATQGGGIDEDYCREAALSYMRQCDARDEHATVEDVNKEIADADPMDIEVSGYRLIRKWLTE